MKKLLAISLSLALLLTTVACGGNKNEEPSSSEGSSYEDVMNPESSLEDSTDEPEAEDPDAEEPETPAEDKEDEKAPSSNSGSNNTSSQKPAQDKPASGSGNNGSSNNNSNNSGNTNNKPSPPASNNYSGTLPELINAIYAKQPVEIMVNDPTPVDLSDANAVNNFLGLTDASKVKEAYYSEAMIGSQAYSLVVVRTNSAADAPAVAQSMFDGINQAKWVCVSADCVAVGAYGDTVMLVMVNSGLGGATLHTDLRAAYASVVGGKLDVSLDRVSAS